MTEPVAIARIAEYGEAWGYADLYRAGAALFPGTSGPSFEQVAGAYCFHWPGLPTRMFNRVVGLGISEPATEAAVDRIVAAYRETGVQFMVQLAPQAQPAELPEWLQARGLQPARNWVKCLRGMDPAPQLATDLEIRPVGPEWSGPFGELIRSVFGWAPESGALSGAVVGRPGWRHYMAFDGERPVATGAFFLENGVASLGYATTLPEYRRRGAQGALLARRIQDAVESGCRWMVIETGEDTPENPNPSFHNMLRTGFRPVYLRRNYSA